MKCHRMERCQQSRSCMRAQVERCHKSIKQIKGRLPLGSDAAHRAFGQLQGRHTNSNKSLPKNSSTHTELTTISSRRLNAKTSHSLDARSTALDGKESVANKSIVLHVTRDKNLQEANDEIQRLNELGLGEDISSEEFLEYFEQLPDDPVVNIYTKLDNMQLTPLYLRHTRYHIRYYKLSQKEPKDKLSTELKELFDMEPLEKEDFSQEFLHKLLYFKQLENDGTIDWFFDPDLCRLEDLDDYQRLVPRNYGGCEYVDWDQYQKYFHSYETEQDYLKYLEELSKKLKWMQDYVLMEVTSLKWDKISTRGAYQAVKIATGFSKITHSLAYIGYYECVQNMRFDAICLKGLDGVYFEIWLRVTKQKMSFRDALFEVDKLNKFPSWQDKITYALEEDYSDMEKEFGTCTRSISPEVTEDEANELIAEAVKKLLFADRKAQIL